jgi:excisionase family DNA binding protein
MSENKDADEMLCTTKDVAKFYKVSERHIFNLVKRGELPQPLRLGRSVRFRLSDLKRFRDPPSSSLF